VQDILERRYNATARVLGVVALVIAAVTIVSYQYRAAGAIVELATGFDTDTAILLVVVGVILYTATAGMISVAYIDVVMGVTMLVGMLVTIPFFAKAAGGVDGLRTMLPAENFQIFGNIGLKEALALTLPSMLLALGDANMYQRFFSAKSAGVAKKATLLLIGGVVYIEVLIILNAWFASGLMRDKVDIHGRVIAYAAMEYLPTFLAALILTAMVSIVFSTAIGYLLVPATSIVRDVFQRFIKPDASNKSLVLVSRVTVVVLGLIAYGLSKLSDDNGLLRNSRPRRSSRRRRRSRRRS
jgi:Na+/proline symporter